MARQSRIHLRMQERWIRSLGQEDPFEKEMPANSIILAWEIPRSEEPGEMWSMGSHRVGHDLATKQQQQWYDTFMYKFM